MKKIFLIDYENVKVHGLKGLEKLGETDAVWIFYSENANSLTFDMHRKIMESTASINYREVEVGKKNSLDFQLASALGYMVCANEGAEAAYYIVTKDVGFQCLKHYWAEKAVVELTESIDAALSAGETAVEETIEPAEAAMAESLPEIPEAAAEEIPAEIPETPAEESAAEIAEETVPVVLTLVKNEEAEEEPLADEISDEYAELRTLLSGIPVSEEDLRDIRWILSEADSLTGAHTALQKRFPMTGAKSASLLYRKLKTVIKEALQPEEVPETAGLAEETENVGTELDTRLTDLALTAEDIAVIQGLMDENMNCGDFHNALEQRYPEDDHRVASAIYTHLKTYLRAFYKQRAYKDVEAACSN